MATVSNLLLILSFMEITEWLPFLGVRNYAYIERYHRRSYKFCMENLDMYLTITKHDHAAKFWACVSQSSIV